MNNYNAYSDEQLLPLLREEKPVCDYAFDVLFNRYGSKLFSYCLFLTRNRSESNQVFHDAWLKFFLFIKSGKCVEKVLPFLILTVKHLIYDNARKINRNKKIRNELLTLSDWDSKIENTSRKQDNNELIELIHVAVDSLEDIYNVFQAEDGIRDWSVTGVQTCALPIYSSFQRTPGSLQQGPPGSPQAGNQ